jgi:hypothetical protein
LLAAGAFTGSSRFRDQDRAVGVKIATSMTRRTALNLWESARNAPSPKALTPTHSATEQLLTLLRKDLGNTQMRGQRHNVVLVVVESYGLMNDLIGAAKLESPYRSPAVLTKYEVQSHTIPFDGPTVSGELRELCGLKGNISSSMLARTVANTCLPGLMEKRGYATTAVHGFLGSLFDRDVWYRDLGFESIYFKEDLSKIPSLNECGGSVPGVCDSDIARFLAQSLNSRPSNKPSFYYWLTLNSHLPVEISAENSALLACASPEAPNRDMSICNWMALIYRVNTAIAELSTNDNLSPTEFIVVGDHAPPFEASGRRQQFSQRVVPFIHLTPKTVTDTAKRQ